MASRGLSRWTSAFLSTTALTHWTTDMTDRNEFRTGVIGIVAMAIALTVLWILKGV